MRVHCILLRSWNRVKNGETKMGLIFETDFSDCTIEGNYVKRNGKTLFYLHRSAGTTVEIIDCECEGGKALHLKCPNGDTQPKLRIEVNIPYSILEGHPYFKVETAIRFSEDWRIYAGPDYYGWAMLSDPVIEWDAATQQSYYLTAQLQRYYEDHLFMFQSWECCPHHIFWVEPLDKKPLFPMLKLGEFNNIDYIVKRGNAQNPNGDASFTVNGYTFSRSNVRTWGMKDNFTSSVCKLYGEDIPKERWVSFVRLTDMSIPTPPPSSCEGFVCPEGEHCELIDGVPTCVLDVDGDNRFLLLLLIGAGLLGMVLLGSSEA